ncbi:MAG: hypothetical protein ABIW50_05425 [Candidatus Limnocylindria bacterium]
MDFSKLSQNDKLAVYGSAAVIVGGLVGVGAAGLGIVAVLAAAGMLAVIFLPQMSPETNLPGSKGSLMLLLGAAAGVILVLGLLSIIGAVGLMLQFAALNTLFYLIAVAGGILIAWVGWKEFQAEGGKFQLGTSTASERPAVSPAAAAPAADSAPREPASEPPASEPTASEPAADRAPSEPASEPAEDDRPIA